MVTYPSVKTYAGKDSHPGNAGRNRTHNPIDSNTNFVNTMRIGIIACSILRQELQQILAKLGWQPEVVYLDAALHVKPLNMRAILVDHIRQMAVAITLDKSLKTIRECG